MRGTIKKLYANSNESALDTLNVVVLVARNENKRNPYGPVPPELTDAQSPQSTLCVYPRLGQLVLQYTPLAYTS